MKNKIIAIILILTASMTNLFTDVLADTADSMKVRELGNRLRRFSDILGDASKNVSEGKTASEFTKLNLSVISRIRIWPITLTILNKFEKPINIFYNYI
ncbi:MAG: hypothetical protein M0P77_10555 [Firmicutes bacterium]|nr:hypothetical protein [Bacillota bacterium]